MICYRLAENVHGFTEETKAISIAPWVNDEL